MFYADNVRSAENKMAAAISSLGHSLAPLSNGFKDSGMRQDLFHLLQRWGKALNWSSGLIQAASTLHSAASGCLELLLSQFCTCITT